MRQSERNIPKAGSARQETHTLLKKTKIVIGKVQLSHFPTLSTNKPVTVGEHMMISGK